MSLLAFLGRPLPLTELAGLDTLLALLFWTSVSDSELLSGEKILFFLSDWLSDFEFVEGLELDLGVVLLLFSTGGGRAAVFACLVLTVAVALGLADDRLLGGAVLAGGGFGGSSSLEDEILATAEGRLLFSSFFLF